jgi:hypothetical protein
MKKIFTILLTQIAFVLMINAQNVELKIELRNGDIVSGKSSMNNITLNTQYGKLQIPIQNVHEIIVGVTPDNKNKNSYIKLIKQLAAGSEELAQKSFDELLKSPIGAIPVIEEFINSEESFNLNFLPGLSPFDVVNSLKGLYNIENYNTEDVLTIDFKYSIGGIYDFKNINLKTEYGNLTIDKEKIFKIEIFYFDANNKNSTFKLIASKHISGNPNGGWLNTGIFVKAGQKITIKSSGTITLASLSNNQYTPDGKSGDNFTDENLGYEEISSNYPTYGNVVFKVGDNGEILKAGSNYTGIVKETGILYLSIYETVYNPANKGYYIVNISVK